MNIGLSAYNPWLRRSVSRMLIFLPAFRLHSFYIHLFFLMLFSGVAIGVSAEPGVGRERILLGQSAAFSGSSSIIGVQMNFGMKLYFDAVNAKGGVYGRKLELQAEDDMYEASMSAENTKQLLLRDNVFALIGYVGNATSVAAIPIVSKAKVPFFAPLSGTAQMHNPFNKYLFSLRASYAQEVEYLVRHLGTIGIRNVGVFYEDDTDGRVILRDIENTTRSANISLTATSMVSANAVAADDSSIRQAVVRFSEKKPEAIVLASTYSSSSALIKELRKAGFIGQFYCLSLVGTRALSESLGIAGEGVVLSQVVPSPWSPKFSIATEYRQAMKKAGKTDLDFTSLEGFMAAKAFVLILQQVGRELTRERFIDTAERMGNIELGDFPIRFSPDSHGGSKFVDLVLIGKDQRFIR